MRIGNSMSRLTYVVGVMVAGVFAPATGCADPSPAAPAAGSAVTLQDLLSAPVPALCQHDPGNLYAVPYL